MKDYVLSLIDWIPAIVISVIGGMSGEIIKSEKLKRYKFGIAKTLGNLIVWFFAGIMAACIVIELDISVGAKVLTIGMSGFISKEFLSLLASQLYKRLDKLGVKKGNDDD